MPLLRSFSRPAALVVLTVVATLVTLPAPARAESPTLTLTVAPAYAGEQSRVAVTLSADEGTVAGAEIEVERRAGGTWVSVETVVTDANGAAATRVTVGRDPAENRVRATWAGDEIRDPVTREETIPLRRRTSKLKLSGPKAFVDETKAKLSVLWKAGGEPVPGSVQLQRRTKKGWKVKQTRKTGEDGRVSFRVSPRRNSQWRAKGLGQPWVKKARSARHKLRNLPPGNPVRLPRAAPRPRVKLPAQKHAKGKGSNAVITRIPDKVWKQMVGRSWHRGCPVGRSGLRLLRINYWDYRGYRRRGELVAATGAITHMTAALKEMYARKLPIRSMYRVDRFGWSKKLQGADDYKSMAAGNTSAFNCREVVGRPGVRSPHASGRALDVNPWENPYRARHGWTPNSWWVSRTHKRVAWRSSSHQVVRLMRRHGMRWTYGTSDLHHFDAAVNGRVVLPAECLEQVCH